MLLDQDEHVYLADFGLTRRLGEAAARSTPAAPWARPTTSRPNRSGATRSTAAPTSTRSPACSTSASPASRPSGAAPRSATLFAHLEEAPPAPPGLEDVLAKALAKDPAERYPTCVEPRRRRPQRARARAQAHTLALALAAVGLGLLAAALLAFFLTRGDGGGPATSGGGSPDRPGDEPVERTIGVGNGPTAVAVDESGVWVANHDDGTVWRIDPAAGPLR